MKLPETLFGIKTEEAYKRVVEGSSAAPPSTSVPIAHSPSHLVQPGQYLILPGQQHDAYSYSDLLVSTTRKYQGKKWQETHEILAQTQHSMLSIRQFVDLLNLLKSGKVHDGATGARLHQTTIDTIVDGILTVRDPWRAEWLDAAFKTIQGIWHINYGHRMVNGVPQPQYSEPLESHLHKDRTPGIDCGDWLKNATCQGLPSNKIKKGDLYFWHPQQDAVARFGASSGGAYLSCGRGPQGSDSALGVRPAREK